MRTEWYIVITEFKIHIDERQIVQVLINRVLKNKKVKKSGPKGSFQRQLNYS